MKRTVTLLASIPFLLAACGLATHGPPRGHENMMTPFSCTASLTGPAGDIAAGLATLLLVSDISSMEQVVAESVARQRFSMLLLGVFAGLARVLAAVGIYGVMSYAVAQRTHEIGIRMALGAQRSDVLKLTIGQGLRLVVTGVVIGFAAAFVLTRVMASLLFGISPTDSTTFITISLVLISVAALASYIPALRATRVDPMFALRYE